jgi:hypothetical protein
MPRLAERADAIPAWLSEEQNACQAARILRHVDFGRFRCVESQDGTLSAVSNAGTGRIGPIWLERGRP